MFQKPSSFHRQNLLGRLVTKDGSSTTFAPTTPHTIFNFHTRTLHQPPKQPRSAHAPRPIQSILLIQLQTTLMTVARDAFRQYQRISDRHEPGHGRSGEVSLLCHASVINIQLTNRILCSLYFPGIDVTPLLALGRLLRGQEMLDSRREQGMLASVPHCKRDSAYIPLILKYL